jgi:hypothetical protein
MIGSACTHKRRGVSREGRGSSQGTLPASGHVHFPTTNNDMSTIDKNHGLIIQMLGLLMIVMCGPATTICGMEVDKQQERAVAEIEKVGGRIDRGETDPGGNVIGVFLNGSHFPKDYWISQAPTSEMPS